MQVPFRVLLQQHMPRGERRAKKPYLPRYVSEPDNISRWVPPRPPVMMPHQRPLPAIRPMFPSHHAPVQNLEKGNLLWQDYRFFYGAKAGSSQFSRCRACRRPFSGVKARREHIEKHKCTVWLVEAYKILNCASKLILKCFEKRECVMCGAQTNEGTWGVPLCRKPNCMERWMFDDEMPPGNLMRALVATSKPLVDIKRIIL